MKDLDHKFISWIAEHQPELVNDIFDNSQVMSRLRADFAEHKAALDLGYLDGDGKAPPSKLDAAVEVIKQKGDTRLARLANHYWGDMMVCDGS